MTRYYKNINLFTGRQVSLKRDSMKNFSETIIDGEKYISSKQAANLANYTSDYIGQLCRGEKIKARRIGRDWFVSESSLLAYQNKLPEPIIFEKPIELSRQSRTPETNNSIYHFDFDSTEKKSRI